MNGYVEDIEKCGYCRIPGVIAPRETAWALGAVRELAAGQARPPDETVPLLNRGHSIVYNLQNKDLRFLELLFASSELEALALRFLNDPWYRRLPPTEPNYVLRSYLARSSGDALPLHIDSFVPYVGNHLIVMQALVVLEDMRTDNGCTVVVPGSHRSGEYAAQTARADAVAIEADAGDLIVWDSRLWHGTTANASGRSRWSLVATFARWWLKQAFDIPRGLPDAIYRRLDDRQRSVLGFCSTPLPDETHGVDLKRGYEALPEATEPVAAP